MIKGRMIGVGEMVGKLKEINKKFPDRVARALYTEMQIDATEMKKRTPVDTTPHAPHPGQLRNSIHVLKPERHGASISVTVATGQEAPYDIYVHENLESYHPVGQAKFMESVLQESMHTMNERVGARLNLDKEE